jgi:hypothetical protein
MEGYERPESSSTWPGGILPAAPRFAPGAILRCPIGAIAAPYCLRTIVPEAEERRTDACRKGGSVSRESRVVLAAIVITIAVGSASALLVVLTWFRSHTHTHSGELWSSSELWYFLVPSLSGSTFFTVPGGLLAASIATRAAARQPPVRSLSVWILPGTVQGALCGVLCLGLPLFLFAYLLVLTDGRGFQGVVVAYYGAVVGALTGAVAGCMIGAYCYYVTGGGLASGRDLVMARR